MERSFLETNRHPALIIVFTMISFGIYGLYWVVKFQDDIKEKSGEGFGGIGTILASMFSFGIYGLYWNYVTGKRLVKAKITDKDDSVLYIILAVFGMGGINMILWQLTINKHADSLQ